MMQTLERSSSLAPPPGIWPQRRQHERFPVSISIELTSMSGRQDARICDISMGGCYIDCICHANAGETLGFEVSLPTGQRVELQGTVAHALPGFGFGLSFSHLSEADLISVEQLILGNGGQVPQRRRVSRQSSESVTPQRPSLHRILVADDDPAIRQLIVAIAQQEGHPVITAKDGQEAYEVLRSKVPISIAILDMKMPHMDGLDLVHFMRSVPGLSDIPVGTVTAETDPRFLSESLAAGVSMFLPKPFTPDQVRFMFKALMSNRAPQQVQYSQLRGLAA